tara:strand:+ start:2713 stop:3612 length:900 start_codon:yes stop_codon:yes gene_type:complete
MPTVSGTLQTYTQVGKREDVEDIIYDISPTNTPMLSSIGTSTAAATLHQWLQDELAAVATNANVEGADAGTASTITQTVKTANTQIFDKVVQVSGTAEAVGTYGRTSDLAYAIAKAGKEIKRDIEHSFVGAGQAGTAGNGSTARQLTSAANQIASATTNTAGSNRAFTEALLLDVLQKCFEEGGEPNQVQVTPSHSVTVAGFATASGRQRDFATGTTLVNAVDIIISPFGQVSVVPNRFLDANTVLVLDTEYWSRAVLRPMQTVVLAKTGDSDKRQMLTELTLVCENDKASGKIDALTA